MTLAAPPVRLAPAPSPVDNPLKGLVPYANPKAGRFPHSLEFTYLPLAGLMTGPEEFNWEPLDRFLAGVAGRGNQAVFRVWLEFPTQPTGVPRFLIDQGVKITERADANEHPPSHDHTPDYSDERLVESELETFIAACSAGGTTGIRASVSSRPACSASGASGTMRRDRELFASIATQVRVMRAYQNAFKRTPILLRYPTGINDRSNAANASLPFGYHDDSFAWGTLPLANPYSPVTTEDASRRRRNRPPKRRDGWHFLVRMQGAGAETLDKWKTHPIGGEIRPELWGQIFDEKPANSHAQDFAECVRQSHVTWLMDSGMFREQARGPRYDRAVALVRRMGYDFYVESADIARPAASELSVALEVINQGAAPFYRDWALELGILSPDGKVVRAGQPIGSSPVCCRAPRPAAGRSRSIWGSLAAKAGLWLFAS